MTGFGMSVGGRCWAELGGGVAQDGAQRSLCARGPAQGLRVPPCVSRNWHLPSVKDCAPALAPWASGGLVAGAAGGPTPWARALRLGQVIGQGDWSRWWARNAGL